MTKEGFFESIPFVLRRQLLNLIAGKFIARSVQVDEGAQQEALQVPFTYHEKENDKQGVLIFHCGLRKLYPGQVPVRLVVFARTFAICALPQLKVP